MTLLHFWTIVCIFLWKFLLDLGLRAQSCSGLRSLVYIVHSDVFVGWLLFFLCLPALMLGCCFLICVLCFLIHSIYVYVYYSYSFYLYQILLNVLGYWRQDAVYGLQIVKKFPAFYGAQKFIIVFTKPAKLLTLHYSVTLLMSDILCLITHHIVSCMTHIKSWHMFYMSSSGDRTMYRKRIIMFRYLYY
jgi:hypothetical protein